MTLNGFPARFTCPLSISKINKSASIVSWDQKNQGGSWVKKAPHAPDHNYE